MGIKQDYLEASVDAILAINPSFDRDAVTAIVRKQLKDKLQDPTVKMDNNVTLENFKLTLTELCNWLDKERPVVSGNATFYVQPTQLVSPASNMLRAIKKQRKAVKREMFESKGDPDKYQQLDLVQSNIKVIMNAEYGASGAPTSAFYTRYSPAATTLMAQSIITTMAAFFEGFVGDNMKFYHFNECLDWMSRIRTEKKDKLDKWLVIPDYKEVHHRIRQHFIRFDPADNEPLLQYLRNCSETELAYIFYVNNLNEFIRRHRNPTELIGRVLEKLPLLEASDKEVPSMFRDKFNSGNPKDDINDYNDYVAREMFLDPYSVPPVIKDEMEGLITTVMKYCFIDYLTPDSITKLNNHKRNTILLVDTDSNVIHANLFTSFILGEVFSGETFGRGQLYNDMICANILAAILDKGVLSILDRYGRIHNADEEARKELAMKNEFFFRRFFLMNTKKRYASSIVLREGHIVIPFKTEIKGLDFIKAGVTDDVTERFTRILEDNVLFSDELQLHEVMRELRKFEREIHDNLREGSMTYLKTQGYKAEGAYKNPWGTQTFKAVMVWNAICPDQKIYSLNKIKLAKLVVNEPDDLDVIKDTFPTEYQTALTAVFGSKERYAEYQEKRRECLKNHGKMIEEYFRGYPPLMKSGMNTIAIPASMSQIPEWIRPLLDYQTIVADICNSFRSVLDSFRIDEVPVKTPNGKANMTTGLISI